MGTVSDPGTLTAYTTPSDAPSSVEAEVTFTLSTTVCNQGNGQAALTNLRYYRSTNSTISTSDTQIGTNTVSILSASHTGDGAINLHVKDGHS